ncbi:hypothetical protein CVS40_11580 [Lucilia cuprina]|nr:hypothetical protein CVS40_11580 [Lucilia cuprina]
MEDALLESDKEVMEVEDQGSKVAAVADPAPATIPDPVPAPTPSLTLTLTPTSASDLAPELPTLVIACLDTAAAPPTTKSSKEEHSGSKVSESSKSKCLQCKGKHPLYKCAHFRKLSHEQKLRFVMLHRNCYRCLSTKHLAIDCKSPMKCNVCNESHHTLLHASGKGPSKKVVKSKGKPSCSVDNTFKARLKPTPSHISNVPVRHMISLSPTLKVSLLIGNRSILVRAVIDLYFSMSYVCESLIQQLPLLVSTLNGDKICRLTIASIYAPYPQITLTATVRKMLEIRTPTETISTGKRRAGVRTRIEFGYN